MGHAAKMRDCELIGEGIKTRAHGKITHLMEACSGRRREWALRVVGLLAWVLAGPELVDMTR